MTCLRCVTPKKCDAFGCSPSTWPAEPCRHADQCSEEGSCANGCEDRAPVAYLRSITHPDWLEVCNKDAPGAFPVFPSPAGERVAAASEAQQAGGAVSEGQIDAALRAFDTDRWDFNLSEDDNRRKAMRAALSAAGAAQPQGEKQ